MARKQKPLNVDLEMLCIVFSSSMEETNFLDLKTGEIIFLSDDIVDEDDEALRERIDESSGDDFISIPSSPSFEGYNDMVDFTETVKDDFLREKLYIALDGKGAFRRFKNVLLDYPKEENRWFEFRDARILKRVKDWLRDEGIDVFFPD